MPQYDAPSPLAYTIIIDGAPCSPVGVHQADAVLRAALAMGRRCSVLAQTGR